MCVVHGFVYLVLVGTGSLFVVGMVSLAIFLRGGGIEPVPGLWRVGKKIDRRAAWFMEGWKKSMEGLPVGGGIVRGRTITTTEIPL